MAELDAREAIPQLIKVLKDPEEWVRKSAAKALGILKAREAVPALIEKIDDPSSLVRKSVIRSLGQIGGADAIEALRRAHSQHDKDISKMAEQALEKIIR